METIQKARKPKEKGVGTDNSDSRSPRDGPGKKREERNKPAYTVSAVTLSPPFSTQERSPTTKGTPPTRPERKE